MGIYPNLLVALHGDIKGNIMGDLWKYHGNVTNVMGNMYIYIYACVCIRIYFTWEQNGGFDQKIRVPLEYTVEIYVIGM